MVKLPLANHDLIVQSSATTAFQVPNVKATIFEGQRTVVPADQRTLELKVAVLTAPDDKFWRVNIHRTRPTIGNLQCYFHRDHHPSCGFKPLPVFSGCQLSCYGRSDIGEPAKLRVPG